MACVSFRGRRARQRTGAIHSLRRLRSPPGRRSAGSGELSRTSASPSRPSLARMTLSLLSARSGAGRAPRPAAWSGSSGLKATAWRRCGPTMPRRPVTDRPAHISQHCTLCGMTERSDSAAIMVGAAEDPAPRSPVKPQAPATPVGALGDSRTCIDDRAGWLCDRLGAAAPGRAARAQRRAL